MNDSDIAAREHLLEVRLRELLRELRYDVDFYEERMKANIADFSFELAMAHNEHWQRLVDERRFTIRKVEEVLSEAPSPDVLWDIPGATESELRFMAGDR